MEAEPNQLPRETPDSWEDVEDSEGSEKSEKPEEPEESDESDDDQNDRPTPDSVRSKTVETNQYNGKGRNQNNGKGLFRGKGKGHIGNFHEHGRGRGISNLSSSLSLAEAELKKATALVKYLELKSLADETEQSMWQPLTAPNGHPFQHPQNYHFVPNQHIPLQPMMPCISGKGHDKKFTVDCKYGAECNRFRKDNDGRVRFVCTFRHSREQLERFFAKCKEIENIVKQLNR